MKIKIFIDVYGRIGVAEKFPNDEQHAGLQELLDELVYDDFHDCHYKTFKSGFYIAEMELDQDFDCADKYMKIGHIKPVEQCEVLK